MYGSLAIFNVSMWFRCDGKFGGVWRSKHTLKLQALVFTIQTWTWQITSVSAVWNVWWVNWCLVVHPWLWKATLGGRTPNTARTQWLSAISFLLLVRRPLWDWCRWCTFSLYLLQCNSEINKWILYIMSQPTIAAKILCYWEGDAELLISHANKCSSSQRISHMHATSRRIHVFMLNVYSYLCRKILVWMLTNCIQST